MISMEWMDRKAVEKVVSEIAACPMIKKFYPTIIAKRAHVPLEISFRYLLDFVKQGMLTIKWEVRCIEYDCARTVITMDNIPADGSYEDCPCGDEVEINTDNLFPVFLIMPEYRKSCIEDKHDAGKKKSLGGRR